MRVASAFHAIKSIIGRRSPECTIVITTNHEVEHASKIVISLQDGRRLEAKLVGSDHADAAILKIGPEHLTAIPFGDSDKLRVGDFVVAIGDPALGGLTVTSGIVGSLHYRALENQRPASFIRSDARSNAGYSGGALVTLRGELD